MDKPNTKSFLTDEESDRAIIEGLTAELKAEYDSFGSRSLESCFRNRVMILYTLSNRKPTNIELLKFGDITVSAQEGPLVDVSRASETIEFGVTPIKIKDRDIFLSVPQHFELKWKAKKVPGKHLQFIAHYAVLMKTRSRPHLQVEGHTYCEKMNDFKNKFPDVEVAY